MTTTTHKQEIEVTRVGGFGGSDANLFYRVGLRGLSALNNTDKKRIRVAKGMDEYKSIQMNDAMQRGHDFEDFYEVSESTSLMVREALFSADLAKNFKTFFHAFDHQCAPAQWYRARSAGLVRTRAEPAPRCQSHASLR